jgi:hypothetical protein
MCRVWVCQVNILVPMQALSEAMGHTVTLTTHGRTTLPSKQTGHWYAIVSPTPQARLYAMARPIFSEAPRHDHHGAAICVLSCLILCVVFVCV